MFFLSLKIIWDHLILYRSCQIFLRLLLVACGLARLIKPNGQTGPQAQEGQTLVSTNAVAPSIEGLLCLNIYMG